MARRPVTLPQRIITAFRGAATAVKLDRHHHAFYYNSNAGNRLYATAHWLRFLPAVDGDRSPRLAAAALRRHIRPLAIVAQSMIAPIGINDAGSEASWRLHCLIDEKHESEQTDVRIPARGQRASRRTLFLIIGLMINNL